MEAHPRPATTARTGARRRVAATVAALLAMAALASCSTAGAGPRPKDGPGPKIESIPSDDPGSDDPGSDDPGSDDPGSDDPGSDEPGPDDPGSDEPGSDVSDVDEDDVDEFTSETEAIASIVEDFWGEMIVDQAGVSAYEAPVDRIDFVGSTDTPPSCGGQQVTAQNAFYCPPDNTLIFDVEWLAASYDDIGDTFIYVLVAHEYAHSAQANLGDPAEQDIELQADCFAGATLQHLIDEGEVELEDGDEMEINQTLAFLAGEWGTTDIHGSLAQRSVAFEHGRDNGVAACQATTDYISWS